MPPSRSTWYPTAPPYVIAGRSPACVVIRLRTSTDAAVSTSRPLWAMSSVRSDSRSSIAARRSDAPRLRSEASRCQATRCSASSDGPVSASVPTSISSVLTNARTASSRPGAPRLGSSAMSGRVTRRNRRNVLTGPGRTGQTLTMVVRRVGLLGVPTSVGAFAPGQEDAPPALRAAGLIEGLLAAGIGVDDLGDLERRRWTPDPASPAAQNVTAVAEVSKVTADRVGEVFDPDRVLLVLGGDCSIEVGVVAGHAAQPGRVGLLYVDLHADLNTPTTAIDGALDWMVVSHLLGAPGTLPSVIAPLLVPQQVRYFGLDQNRLTPGERDLLAELGIPYTSAKRIARDPIAEARLARDHMADFDHLLVHFDVDLIDFNDLPLSENAGRAQGLPADVVMLALGELLRAPNLRALTVTEVNPHHGAEDGSTIVRFTEALVTALAT